MAKRGSLPAMIALVALMALPLAAAAEFCADLKAKYGDGIMRCVDFARPIDAAMNKVVNGRGTIGTDLFDSAITATPGATGALHWKMRSYNQVKADEPTLTNGQAYIKAIQTNNYLFQRWIGVERLTPGRTYYYQFKLRFNNAFRSYWGGTGPKIMGMDAGCRTVNGVKKPTICENFTDPNKFFTKMGTASSLEFATMTTTNWFPTGYAPDSDKWPYPVMYQGSANWGGTVGFTPPVFVENWGAYGLEQPGPDSGLVWNDVAQRYVGGTTCDNGTRVAEKHYGNNPGHVMKGVCVTYGDPDVWHEITIAFRPSGNFYDTNRAAKTNRTYRHDSLFKTWYDGKLIVNFDPDEPSFRTGEPSKAACAARQEPSPPYDYCHTGIDIYKDSRDVNRDPDSESFDADVTQFILWTFNYRRGYAPGTDLRNNWCTANIQPTDQGYSTCLDSIGSGESATNHPQWDAFLTHSEVNVYMDDWVVSTVPLPMKTHPSGAQRQ